MEFLIFKKNKKNKILVKNPFTDYNNLTANGVKSIGRNFYLEVKANDKVSRAQVGVWHILPASVSKSIKLNGNLPTDNEIENLMDTEMHSILIYFHGNSFDRTTTHRCNLYNFLSDMGFHLLAIDYRGFLQLILKFRNWYLGYGDSKGLPSEDGLVTDAKAIYEYARLKAPYKNIFIWGHSMGTGIATRAVSEFSIAGNPPDALILESPFSNLRDVIRGHPLSYPLRLFSWYFIKK